MRAEASLLCDLHRARRQDENFVTAAFANLLQHFAFQRSPVAVELLQLLTGCPRSVASEALGRLSITTQARIAGGVLDLKISGPNLLIYVEVKVKSPVDDCQLRKYRDDLEQNASVAQKFLVLLTRRPPPASAEAIVHKATRWVRVADCLDAAVRSQLDKDPIGRFLADQFLSFLASRGMAMKKIEGALAGGLQSLRNMLMMVEEALRANGVRPRLLHATKKYIGYNCDHNGVSNKFWVGVTFKWPNHLFFETYQMPVGKHDAEIHNIGGEIRKKSWAKSGFVWLDSLDFSSDNSAFYQAVAPDQYQRIESFLNQCLKKVGRLEQAKDLAP